MQKDMAQMLVSVVLTLLDCGVWCVLGRRALPLCLPLQVDPTKGTVGFGSGLHGWAFTLKQFAEIYSSKFKIDPPKLMKRLWGDQFYNAKERKWNKSGGEGYVRGFCQFVLDPIFKVRLLV